MIATDFETLLLTMPAPHVMMVTLNRPTSANAFNTQMARDIITLFEAVALDPRTIDGSSIRCLVITGAGERAFCAGGDLKERNGMSDDDWGKQHLVYERMARSIIDCPSPVIAAVNGAAFGGGCEIAAASDFVYAADTARFALTETTLGIIPGAGGTQTLSRAIGTRRAKEVILTGRPFTATQAQDWGLVNEICPAAELRAKVLDTATAIASNAPVAVRQAKQAIQRGENMSLSDGLAFEIEAYNRTVPTEDRHEGVRAFNEKRKPDFKGR